MPSKIARDPTLGSPLYIDQPKALEEYCRRLLDVPVLAVDTEFVRERTFYPGLGLIQVCDGRQNALIDPVAIEDLSSLTEIFVDENIVKVFHSCSEDMEALHHHLGEVPKPVFDSQIAAAFAGHGYSLGLSGLTTRLFDVEIPKQQTRTNWLRRPLSKPQKEYAALDVAYLLPIYDTLIARLDDLGRTDWVLEECEAFRDTSRFETDPAEAFTKFRRTRGLDRQGLGILRALAVWRETEARQRNLARNFVLREAMLPLLAKRRPRSYKALQNISELRPEELRRHGRALMHLIRGAIELPKNELPQPVTPPLDLTPHKPYLDKMRRLVIEVGDRMDLPPELLATRRTLESLTRRSILGREPQLPAELEGWRFEVVGKALLEVVHPLHDGGEL